MPADLKGEIVYLAAPMAREGVTEIDFGDGQGDEMCRWRATDEDLRDHTNAGDEPEPVQTAALTLRLLRQRDATDGYALLGVVRVMERRSDNQLVLDRAYIAPQTRIEASGQLSATATLLHGLVQRRTDQIGPAQGFGQLQHAIAGRQEVGAGGQRLLRRPHLAQQVLR